MRMSEPHIFDFLEWDDVVRAAKKAGQIGVIGPVILELLEDGEMLLHFHLLNVHRSYLIAANDSCGCDNCDDCDFSGSI